VLAPESFELTDVRTQRRVLAILNRSEGLQTVSNQVLLRLMSMSRLRQFQPQDVLWRQGEVAGAAWVILHGAVSVAGTVAETDVAASTAIGVAAVLHGQPFTSSGAALTEVTALEIPRAALHLLAETSTGLRRALRHTATVKGYQLPTFVQERERDCVEWVVSCLPPGWSESAFVGRLARAWMASLPDRLTVVVVDPAHDGAPVHQSGDVPVVRVAAGEVPPDDIAFAAAVGIAEQSYLLLDTGACAPAERVRWRHRAEKVIAVQDGGHRPDTAGVPRAAVLVPVVRVPGAVGRVAPNAVRVRLDPGELTGNLTDAGLAGLQRLARSVSDRTVALALGGGGAWGYAHVALIRAIARKGVPIDMVAGVSFGAMVGAYYCANGLAGLDVLVARGGVFHRWLPAAMATSHIIGMLARRDLGHLQLDDFEVPFFPVATDVAAGEAVAIQGKSMSFGVRASGSFPGVFSPTTGSYPDKTTSVRFVDGGIRDNVPEAALLAAGADLLVASNIVPLPAPQKPTGPMINLPFWRYLHELNPLGRMQDAWRSTFILFHSAGETGTLSADVVYDSKPNEFLATSFKHAAGIVRAAEPEVEPVAEELARRWQLMLAKAD